MEGGELAPGQKESVGSGTDPESKGPWWKKRASALVGMTFAVAVILAGGLLFWASQWIPDSEKTASLPSGKDVPSDEGQTTNDPSLLKPGRETTPAEKDPDRSNSLDEKLLLATNSLQSLNEAYKKEYQTSQVQTHDLESRISALDIRRRAIPDQIEEKEWKQKSVSLLKEFKEIEQSVARAKESQQANKTVLDEKYAALQNNLKTWKKDFKGKGGIIQDYMRKLSASKEDLKKLEMKKLDNLLAKLDSGFKSQQMAFEKNDKERNQRRQLVKDVHGNRKFKRPFCLNRKVSKARYGVNSQMFPSERREFSGEIGRQGPFFVNQANPFE